MQDLFNQPLDAFLDSVCQGRPELELARRKVNCLLEGYERHCKYRLRVSDVYLDTPKWGGEVLTSRCVKFINSQPLPQGRDPKRHRRGMSEDKSALRRFMREHLALRGVAATAETVSLASMNNIPKEWSVLKTILPRTARGPRGASPEAAGRPYSFAAQHFVLALRDVSKRTGVKDLRVLIVDSYTELTRSMKRNSPYQSHARLTTQFSTIRKAYFKTEGMPLTRRRKSLRVDEFPEPFKTQVRFYREHALLGFGGSEKLRRVAREYRYKDEPYSEVTVAHAVEALEAGLCLIFKERGSRPERMSVEDLIKTKVLEVKDSSGRIVDIRRVNEYVEVYRQKQWAQATLSKRAEYDSATFEHFRAAVGVVAAVNGFGEHLPDFRKAYKSQLDRATRRSKKRLKKKIFKRAAVDGEILELKGEVAQIIKAGSFKSGQGAWDGEAHRAMTKILLLVSLSVLRYVGYRQQNLRRCRLGEHVFFNDDRSITFDFPGDVTKNGKHIRITLSQREHGGTHGPLLETLWLYHDRVYPYILQRDSGVQGHFFVNVSRTTGLFRKFNYEEDFYTSFVDWSHAHINYESFPGAHESNLILHPHFFRGLCIDWLIEELGWTRDAVATFIGDEPETLKEYINENMIHDATKLLTRSNIMLKAERAERERPQAEAEFRAKRVEYEKALRAKDEQIQDLLGQSRRLGELLERVKDENEDLLREIRQLREGDSSTGRGVGNGDGKGDGGVRATPRPRRKVRPTSRRPTGA